MAKFSCALAQSPTQIAPDGAIENLLSEIALTAFVTEERMRLLPADEERDELDLDVLRHTIARLGWMADLALKQMGSSSCIHEGNAAPWLLSPVCSQSLAREVQS